MNQVPSGTHLFLDTNILLYAIAEHPRLGPWCDTLLDRIRQGDVAGYISVIVLNELIHKLIIGEVAQKAGLKPGQVIQYLKHHRKVLEDLEAYEILAEVETSYGLVILEATPDVFLTARQLMQACRLLSNDALHLAVMQKAGLRDLATNDADFDSIEYLYIWKPRKVR